MRSWITISFVVTLLLGSVCAADVEEVTTAHRPSYKTAWQFIKSRNDLTYTAYILDVLGLSSSLDKWFSGTLLLPTDAAWATYRQGFALQPNDWLIPNVLTDYGSFTAFFGALMNYHTLRWAVDTKSLWSLIVDTKHFQAPGFNVPSLYHQLTLVNSRSRKPPRKLKGSTADTVTASTFGRKAIDSIRDEQGNSATFVLANNRVSGGGVIHIINAVLQPDDVYPSFSALAAANPQVSIIAGIIEWWEQQYNPTSYYYPYYPWTDPFPFFNGTYVDYDPVPLYDPYVYSSEGSSQVADRATAVQGVTPQLTKNGNFEYLLGTMALPENSPFEEYDIKPSEPWEWRKILQYHFIPAYPNNAKFVQWYGTKWEQKDTTTYFGVTSGNPNYKLIYGGSNSRPTITFIPPNPDGQRYVDISQKMSGNLTNTYKKSIDLKTPGVSQGSLTAFPSNAKAFSLARSMAVKWELAYNFLAGGVPPPNDSNVMKVWSENFWPPCSKYIEC